MHTRKEKTDQKLVGRVVTIDSDVMRISKLAKRAIKQTMSALQKVVDGDWGERHGKVSTKEQALALAWKTVEVEHDGIQVRFKVVPHDDHTVRAVDVLVANPKEMQLA